MRLSVVIGDFFSCISIIILAEMSKIDVYDEFGDWKSDIIRQKIVEYYSRELISD